MLCLPYAGFFSSSFLSFQVDVPVVLALLKSGFMKVVPTGPPFSLELPMSNNIAFNLPNTNITLNALILNSSCRSRGRQEEWWWSHRHSCLNPKLKQEKAAVRWRRRRGKPCSLGWHWSRSPWQSWRSAASWPSSSCPCSDRNWEIQQINGEEIITTNKCSVESREIHLRQGARWEAGAVGLFCIRSLFCLISNTISLLSIVPCQRS